MKMLDKLKERWRAMTARRAAAAAIAESLAANAPKKREPKYPGQRVVPKWRRRAFTLIPGYDWNPLTGYPRNKGCFCGSGKHAKRCCLPSVSRQLPVKEAAVIREIWPKLMTGHLTLPAAPKATK